MLLNALSVAGLLTLWLALSGLTRNWHVDGQLNLLLRLNNWSGWSARWLALSITLWGTLGLWGLLSLASLVTLGLAGVALRDGSSGLDVLGVSVWLVSWSGSLTGSLVSWDGSWLLVVVLLLIVVLRVVDLVVSR